MSYPSDVPGGSHPISEILIKLEHISSQDSVSLGEMLQAFGRTSFLPAIMVPALLVISPLSGIPFFSSTCGICIVIISAQMVMHRDHLWLPQSLNRARFDGSRLQTAIHPLRPVGVWFDNHSRKRFRVLMRRPARKILQVLCLICGALMPIFEVVPFSSSVLGAAVLTFAVALIARDGLIALLGAILLFFAVGISIRGIMYFT